MNRYGRISRQIEYDDCGVFCIDTYDYAPNYPIMGFGYSEQEAIEQAEFLARVESRRLAKKGVTVSKISKG